MAPRRLLIPFLALVALDNHLCFNAILVRIVFYEYFFPDKSPSDGCYQ